MALQEALGAADLRANAAGKDRPHTWDGGQLGDRWLRLALGGDPAIDVLHLAFQETDVLQGEVENALYG